MSQSPQAGAGFDVPERWPENVAFNTRTGERFEFHPDSTDEELRFELVTAPGGGIEELHQHVVQSETFRCVSGELTVLLADGERTLAPGESIDLPAGAAHGFVNRGDVNSVCEVAYRPAGKNEDWLKLVSAIEHVRGRQPGLFDLVPFIGDVGIYLAAMPVWLQRVLFSALKGPAVLIGKRRAGLAATAKVYGRPLTW